MVFYPEGSLQLQALALTLPRESKDDGKDYRFKEKITKQLHKHLEHENQNNMKVKMVDSSASYSFFLRSYKLPFLVLHITCGSFISRL